MPFLPRSVADLLMQHSTVPLQTIAVIARDCIAALFHIHSKGYCFGDVKPSNIMFSTEEHGGAIVVDFGATVRIGDPIVEITDQYCLDVNVSQGSEAMD
jgi:serine/threonine protein kinase